MNIRIIAYRGKNKFGLIVRLLTLGKYDHVAFLMPEGTLADSRAAGFNIYSSHETWNCKADIYNIDILPEQFKLLDQIIRKNAGMWQYDWPGLAGYGIGKLFDMTRYWHHSKMLFCSEAIITFLRQAAVRIYVGYQPNEISPHKLMKYRIFKYSHTVNIDDKHKIFL